MSNPIRKQLVRFTERMLQTVTVQNALTRISQRILADADVQNSLAQITLRAVRGALDDPEHQRKLWLATNIRPEDEGADYGALRVGDVERTKYEIATRSSAEFVL